MKEHDGSDVGKNPASLASPGGPHEYCWRCDHEGVFPFHDGGNYSGGEDGTNVHGLFGALIVEPPCSVWRDPVTGRGSVDDQGNFRELDGLYLDVLPAGRPQGPAVVTPPTTLADHDWPAPVEYHDFGREAHREFVIFFHDEPEFCLPDGELEGDPCPTHSGHHPRPDPSGCSGDSHAGGDDDAGRQCENEPEMPIMPISYRAEPMISRERVLWKLVAAGRKCLQERPVLNEEQHHSSWMFGDPDTPILKAYIGDPVRIRFVHAAVKETHVFHLHLYEWHAVAEDPLLPAHRRHLRQPADRPHDRTGMGRRQSPADRRRRHLALPPLHPLPRGHVGHLPDVRNTLNDRARSRAV